MAQRVQILAQRQRRPAGRWAMNGIDEDQRVTDRIARAVQLSVT